VTTRPMTWSWLGGFFQAEGCLTNRHLTIEQADRRGLDLIQHFLTQELPNARPFKVGGPYLHKTGKLKASYMYSLYTYANTPLLLSKLLPYLHSEKRRRTLESANFYQQQPLDDEWVIGFWEGDGSIRNSGNTIEFYQNDEELLTKIQTHLKLGRIHKDKPHQNQLSTAPFYRLCITINKKNVARIGELLTLVKTPLRLEQLNRILEPERTLI